MTPTVETRSLHKRYGSIRAVTDVSLVLPHGAICGFLGKNGAGKTTTIRMILGLARPDQGEVFLFGQPLATTRREAMRRTGAMIENPAPYPNLTGRENLEVRRRLLDLPAAAMDEALDIVKLAQAAGRKAGGYSTGMKRRLLLASALLGGPELLILDEPTSGLDPEGMLEFRELIRTLPGRFGTSVLLASHYLADVEAVATRVVFVAEGRIRFQGPVAELPGLAGTRLVLRVNDTEAALQLLRAAGFAVFRTVGELVVQGGPDLDAGRINALLNQAGIDVNHIARQQPGLEEIYMQLARRRDV